MENATTSKEDSLSFNVTNPEHAEANLDEVLRQGKTLMESLFQTAEALERKADQWINRSIILLGAMVGFWAKLVSEKRVLLSCYALGIVVALAAVVFLFYRSSAPTPLILLGIEPKSWGKNDNINDDRTNVAMKIGAGYQLSIQTNRERYNKKAKFFGYGLKALLGVSIGAIPLLAFWSLRFLLE